MYYIQKNTTLSSSVFLIGAGDGNRTHAASLEGWNSTIELHPQVKYKYNDIIIVVFCQPFFNAYRCRIKKYLFKNRQISYLKRQAHKIYKLFIV